MPASKSLVWSAEARTDLADVFDYLDLHASRAIADKKLLDIEAAAKRLAQWPLMGRPRDRLRTGLRSWAVPPHVIFYRLTHTAIEVVRVIDGRRDLDSILNPE
jgi:toxin ParE1/3/4